MKANCPLWALGTALGLLLGAGCATPKQSAAKTAPRTGAALSLIEEDLLAADDAIDDLPEGPSHATPEALAHYGAAISYEWNEDDVKAEKQFEQAALADPANERLVIKLTQQLIRDKQTSRALTVISKSARRADASPLILAWLARAELQAGRTNAALADCRRAVTKNPREWSGYQLEAAIEFRRNRLDDALKVLNRAAKSLPSTPAALISLGNFYAAYAAARPQDTTAKTNAIAVLDRAAKAKPESVRLAQSLAESYRRLDEPKKAEQIYLGLLSTMSEPSPLREAFHEKLAGLYFQTEDRTNAMRQLEAIVRDNPARYPRAWFFLGEIAYSDDKLEEAADDYGNAIHWDPNMEEAYYKLALVRLAMHRDGDAMELVSSARARFPRTYTGEYYTGVVYSELKNYAEAIRHFHRAEGIAAGANPSPLDYRFYFQLGEACERNKEIKDAEVNLQKCIDLSPDFGEALNYLGYMLAERGEQLPRARALIEKAVHGDPKNGAYLDSLAWVLYKQNLPREALPWMLQAVEYTPTPDATVMDHLGEIYLALHEPAKAAEAWRKSLSIEQNPEVRKKLDAVTGGA